MSRYFAFIGVTTGQSSIMRIFPVWQKMLRLDEDVRIEGIDLPLHAEPNLYREVVRRIKDNGSHLGGLVTTHKIDLYHAASDLFDEVDSYASLCKEVSCIAKRDDRLLGWAKDPISAGRTLESILGAAYFGAADQEKRPQVLCLGAGGAGVAISFYFLTRLQPEDRPAKLIMTDRDPERLQALQVVHKRIGSAVDVEYVETSDVRVNNELVQTLPPRSMVINATGMGKDSPGSPVSDDVMFPRDGIALELNYRGRLDFLHQARRHRDKHHLRVEDGWVYFIHGWTSIIEEVFQRPINDKDLARLSDAAAFARPKLA